MSSSPRSLTDFQAGTMSTYPLCLPVVSTVPAVGVLALRAGQVTKGVVEKAIGHVGKHIVSEDSEKHRTFERLEQKGNTDLKHGSLGATVAVVQTIPGGALLVREGVQIINASVIAITK
jgi:hypothetical protein